MAFEGVGGRLGPSRVNNWRSSAVAAGHGSAERGADLSETSAPSDQDLWKSLENSEFLRDIPSPRVWSRKTTTNSSPGGEVRVEHTQRGTTGVSAGDTVVAPFTRYQGDLLEIDGTAVPTASELSPAVKAEIDLDLEEAYEYRAELTEICRRIVGDTSLAEDVVQETYLQAVKNIHKLERRDGLMPWLVTVATRRSLNELRRRKYSTVVEEMPERQTAPEFDPCVAVTLTDEFDRVNSIMSTLTTRERDLLMKQVYEGLSLVELAEIEGSSAASVRSVLSRARSKIKTAIAQSGARILLPFTFIADKARRRLEPLMMRLDRFDVTTTAVLSRAEVLGAGVLSLGLALGSPTGGFLWGEDRSATSEPTSVQTPDAGEGGGAGSLLGRSGDDDRDADELTTFNTSGARSRAQAGTTEGGGSAGEPDGGGPDLQPDLPPIDPSQPDGVPGAPEAPPVEPESPVQHAESPEETYAKDGEVHEDDDGNLFFLGTLGNGCTVGCMNLFRSADGGHTWTRALGKGLAGADQILVPEGDRGTQIFAVTAAGLKVSHNDGDHFEPVVGMASAGPGAISPRFTQGDRRILIGSSPALEWNGEQASPITSTPPSAHQKRFAFSPEIAKAETHGKGGQTAEEAEALTEATMLFTGMIEYNQATGASYAGIYGCMVTAGQADVCDQHAVIPEITSVPEVFVSSTFDKDQAVLAWGEGGAFRSKNRGETFTAMDIPFQAVKAIIDDGNGRFYAAGFSNGDNGPIGGVAISKDAGKTWRLVGEGSPVGGGTLAVEVLNDGRIVAAPLRENGGGVWCSSDGGGTWARRCAPRND